MWYKNVPHSNKHSIFFFAKDSFMLFDTTSQNEVEVVLSLYYDMTRRRRNIQ